MDQSGVATQAVPELVVKSETDNLYQLLKAQFELEKEFRDIERSNGFWTTIRAWNYPVEYDFPSTQAFIRDAIGRVIEELIEAQGLLKNKPWKKQRRATNIAAFDEEIGDSIHMFMRLMLILFGDPDNAVNGMMRVYFSKHKINQQRIEDGV